MDLRQAVETAKRILLKEKIDRQLAGQTSPTPLMSIRDNCSKRVTFDMTDNIEQKIDQLMLMMGKLVTEDKGRTNHLNHEYICEIGVEVEIEVIIEAGLNLITSIEVISHIIKILGEEQHLVPIIEIVMAIIHGVIKGMEDITITEEVVQRSNL